MGKSKIIEKPTIDDLPVAVFVEGATDFKFMQVYVEKLFRKDQMVFFVKPSDTVDNLRKEVVDFVKLLKPDCITKAVLVIRDADTDASASKQNVNGMLNEAKKHRDDIKYYSYIFPYNDTTPGSLETLCLGILSEPEKEKYLEFSNKAVDSSDKTVPHHIQKNRLYCYLSLFDEYAEWSLGINADKGAFNLSARELEPLLEILCEIERNVASA
jgi:hypothetical protein